MSRMNRIIYADSLEWAQDNSIIDPAMINFQPEDYITRENMMVLSYKYMLYTGILSKIYSL